MPGEVAPLAVDITALFAPGSIAVIGATPDLAKPGGRCLEFLLRFGFPGRVYPVNPRYEQIRGLPAYPSLAQLPERVDLALVLIAAAEVPAAIEAAGAAGVRAAIVFSSGFREVGPAGAELERQLVEAASRHSVALLGPNCLGYVDVAAKLPATFTTALQDRAELEPGRMAFVSQSGAMGAAIFGLAQEEGAGVGLFASTGNESSLTYEQVFRYIAADERLAVLLGYVEGVSDGRGFVAALRFAREQGRHVALLKVGRSDVGRQAARSHTGALAGSDEAWGAALRRAGAIRADGPRQLLDVGLVLSQPARPAGNRVGIVSMSGGAGVLMADRAAELGLGVPVLGIATQQRLAQVLPAGCTVANPVDFGAAYGVTATIEETVRVVAESPDIDMTLLFLGLSPNLSGHIEARLADVAKTSGKPLVVAWLGGPAEGLRSLRHHGVAAYGDPVTAVEMAAVLREAGRPLPRDLAPSGSAGLREQLAAAVGTGRTALSEAETKGLLAAYGLPVVREFVARTAAEAVAYAKQFAGPVAVKAEAAELPHKSDVGAVALNVEVAEVAESFARVTAAARRAGVEPTGALIAQMAPSGVELLLGARWDEQFGPVVLVGSGGLTSDVVQDTAVDLAPIDAARAAELIGSLRMAPLLGPFRGEPARDLAAAAEALAALSRFAADAGPCLHEIDINPLAVYPAGQGCLALDATASLSRIGE